MELYKQYTAEICDFLFFKYQFFVGRQKTFFPTFSDNCSISSPILFMFMILLQISFIFRNLTDAITHAFKFYEK